MKNNENKSLDTDMLAELGNIGAGNAATALSIMLNKIIQIEVPSVEKCKLSEVSKKLETSSDLKTTIIFDVTGLIEGYMVLVLDDKDVENITKIISGLYNVEMPEEAVLQEVSNIIAASYISALANMMEGCIDISTPKIEQNKLNAIFNSTIAKLNNAADETVIIKSNLIIDKEIISFTNTLIVELNSLNKILEYFKL